MKKSLTWIFILIIGLGISSCSENKTEYDPTWGKLIERKDTGKEWLRVWDSERRLEFSILKKGSLKHIVVKERMKYFIIHYSEFLSIYEKNGKREKVVGQKVIKKYETDSLEGIKKILDKNKHLKHRGNSINRFKRNLLLNNKRVVTRILSDLIILKLLYLHNKKGYCKDSECWRRILEDIYTCPKGFLEIMPEIFYLLDDFKKKNYSFYYQKQKIKHLFRTVMNKIKIKLGKEEHVYLIPVKTLNLLEKVSILYSYEFLEGDEEESGPRVLLAALNKPYFFKFSYLSLFKSKNKWLITSRLDKGYKVLE